MSRTDNADDIVIDADTELQCLGHWVKRLEKYLHVSTSSWRLSSSSTSTFEQLQCHLEVQSAIEKLVYRLADLKRRCCSSDLSVTRNSQHSCSTNKFPNLEKRLKQCWLKSLEKQYLLESLLRENSTVLQEGNLQTDPQEVNNGSYQPLQKCRRLTQDQLLHDSAGLVGRSVLSPDGQTKCQSLCWPVPYHSAIQYSSSKDPRKSLINSNSPLLTASPINCFSSNLNGSRTCEKYTHDQYSHLSPLDANIMVGRKYRRKNALPVNGQQCTNQHEKSDTVTTPALPYPAISMATNTCGKKLPSISRSSDQILLGSTFFNPLAELERHKNDNATLFSMLEDSAYTDSMADSAGEILSNNPAELSVEKRNNLECGKPSNWDQSERFSHLNDTTGLVRANCNSYFSRNSSQSVKLSQKPKTELVFKQASAGRPDKEGKSRSVPRFFAKSKRTGQASRFRARQRDVQRSCNKQATTDGRRHAGLDLESVFWDDYQEKLYSSEAYSETSLDETTIRRITDFGDDYSACLAVPPAFPYIFSRTSPPSQRDRSQSISSCESEIRYRLSIGKEGQINFDDAVVAPLDDATNLVDECAKEADLTKIVEDFERQYIECSTDWPLLGPSIEDLILHCKVVGTQVIPDNECSSVGHALSKCLNNAKTILHVQEILLHDKEKDLYLTSSQENALLQQKHWKEQLDMLEECKEEICQVMNQTNEHARTCTNCLASFSIVMDAFTSLLSHLHNVTLSYKDRIDLCQSCCRLMYCTSDGHSQSGQMASLPDLVKRQMQQSFLPESTEDQEPCQKSLTEAPSSGQESLVSSLSCMEGSVKLMRPIANSINASQNWPYTGINDHLPLAHAPKSNGQLIPRSTKKSSSPSQAVKILPLRTSREKCIGGVKVKEVEENSNGRPATSALVNRKEKTAGNKSLPVRTVQTPRDAVRKLRWIPEERCPSTMGHLAGHLPDLAHSNRRQFSTTYQLIDIQLLQLISLLLLLPGVCSSVVAPALSHSSTHQPVQYVSKASVVGIGLKNSSEHASYDELHVPGVWSFITLMFCGVMVILTVVGNICVIAAVHQSKALQAPQNALIVSLALADLLVGLAVMPFAAITDFLGLWILGAIPCDIWIVLDVCLCTASILHLVAIAFDRYFSITNMRYIQGRNVKLMYVVIGTVWLLSLVLAVGPAMGWRDNLYDQRIANGECLVSQEISFQIFGTTVAFFAPLAGILILYGLIYQQTRTRMRKRMEDTLHSTLYQIAKLDKEATSSASNNNAAPSSIHSTPPSTPNSTTTNGIQLSSLFHNGTWTSRLRAARPFRRSLNSHGPPTKIYHSGVGKICRKSSFSRAGSTQTIRLSEVPPGGEENDQSVAIISSFHPTDDAVSVCPSYTADAPDLSKMRTVKKASSTKSTLSARHQTLLRREKKAATTLAVITLSFVICWLPFFLNAVVRPVCGESCQLPHTIESFFLWLGYANSTLNPLIYTIFSPDFRNAFKKLFHLDSAPSM